jgi:ABC-type bacteriocin/lantibiotic exporter with double-glycine peptidase domain
MNPLRSLYNNVFFNALRNIRALLDLDQKKRAVPMILLLFLNAFLDLLGLFTIGVLIQSALQGDAITGEVYTPDMATSEGEFWFISGLRWMYRELGFVNEMQLLFFLSFAIFIVFIAKNIAALFISYLQARYSYNIALRLSMKMFQYYYDRGYLFISNASSGSRLNAISSIPSAFSGTYLMNVFAFSTDLVILIFIGVGLFSVDPLAVLLITVAVVPTFLAIYQYSKNRAKKMGVVRNKNTVEGYALINEGMQAYTDIKLGNKEQVILDKYEHNRRVYNHAEVLFQGVISKINKRTNDIVFGLGILVIFGYAWYGNVPKEPILTLLGLFAVAAYKVLPAVNNMVNAILLVKNMDYVITELAPIANFKLHAFKEYPRLPFREKISLRDIHFHYPDHDEPVLQGIDLDLHKGETLGIIGGSGSGKTTLLKLFLRLIEENQGNVRMDDTLLDNKADNASFQKIIGYVEQQVFILDGTLRENIAFLEETSDDARLWKVIDDALLRDFVESHPEGLNMRLGENGVKLSGGQKQRVGIARALYKQSEILVLDEITSALDPKTEKGIVEVINHLSDLGKTILIVAHRVTTLERCDRIIEMEKGKVKREVGYGELVREVMG